MARSESKKTETVESENEPPSPEVREEGKSFVGADPAFAELKRAPEKPAEAAVAESVAAHRRILDFLEEFRKATVNIVFAGIIALLALTVFRVIKADELSVDPINLPKNIKEMGYTEDGTALMLTDDMFKIFDAVRLSRHKFNVKAKIHETDVAVPVAGLSFSSAIRLVQQIAGFPQRHISGEFICASEPCTSANLELHLRLMDGLHQPQVLEPIKGVSPSEILKTGAEKVLQIADPMSLAVFLYGSPSGDMSRRKEAVDIAVVVANKLGPDRAPAINLIGGFLIDKPDRSAADVDQAVFNFNEAIKLDPTLAMTYSNLGAALALQNKRQEAITQYHKSLAIDGTQTIAHRQLGFVYYQDGRFGEAAAEFKAAVELDPSDFDSINLWGVALMRSNDMDGAIEKFRDALKIKPDLGSAFYNLATIFKQKGMKAEAKEAFQNYLKFTPDAPDKLIVETTINDLK